MIMNERHAKLLELYKIFLEICQKHDIKFYFTGGSALGAVRHEGFIPWDDDIDMGIMREDWERLKPILIEELPEHLTYVDYMTHPTYAGHITKIVDRDSVDLYRSRLADGTPKGQFLELFILDPVPADKIDYHREMFWIYSELMTPYFPYINTSIKYQNFSFKKYKYYNFLCKLIGKEKVLKSIEKKIFNYDKSKCDYLLLEWGAVLNYYPIENFGEPKFVKFEDTVAPIGARAAALFYQDYGDDWMKYPPLDSQMAHVTIGNAHIPAEEYMKDIFTRVNAKATNKMRIEVKESTVDNFKNTVELNQELLSFKIKHFLHTFNIAEKTKEAEELFKEEKLDLLYKLFTEYYGFLKQSSKLNLDIKLSKELQEYALFAAIAYGKLKLAHLLVNNYLKCSNADHAKADFFKNYIHLFEEIRNEYYDEKYSEAEALLTQIKDGFEKSYMFTTMDIRTKLKLTKVVNVFDEVSRIDNLIEKYSDDYDLIKIKGDLLLLAGKKEEAEKLYDDVLDNSNNGIDVLDINKHRKG